MGSLRVQLESSDTSPLAGSIALERSLLITDGSWVDVGKAALSVYDTVIKRELKARALPAGRGLRYWRGVPHRGLFGIGLFWLQHAPLVSYNLAFRADKSQLLSRIDSEEEAPSMTAFTENRLRSPEIDTRDLAHFVESAARYVFFQWNRIKSFLLLPIRARVKQEETRLKNVRVASNKVIGVLLSESWLIHEGQSTEETIRRGIDLMSEAVGLAPRNIDTPANALRELQAILDQVNTKPVLVDFMPSSYIRWWPVGAVALVGAFWIIGSWREIAEWVDLAVIDTLQSFWSNWIVDPLYQVYLTIRHDENADIALMGKQSLQSDLDSLERMVVSFVSDTNTTDNSAAALDYVREQVRQGDLTPVLQAYEKQLASPVASLITGRLIRTLLIQVQKTKVDAEVALSGIDKMLQSQQLVFGLIAAIPALAFVLWTGRFLLSQPDVRGAIVNRTVSKERLFSELSSIEGIAMKEHELSDEDLGEVYCIIAELKQFIRGSVLASESEQFSRDLDRLMGLRNSQQILDALLRIYAKY